MILKIGGGSIDLIFATHFYDKKIDTSLRKTGSSWEKMSIHNLSVPLFLKLYKFGIRQGEIIHFRLQF